MLSTILENAIDSYRAPRRAVRKVIDSVDGFEGVAIIFGLAFCLNAIILVLRLFVFETEDPASGGALSVIFANLLVSVAAFATLVGLVQVIGRMFGGTGSLRDVATAVAWHSLVTVIFAPFIATNTLPEGAALIQIAIALLVLWLLANFIAEVHGFASVWKVAGVMVAGVFVAGFVLSFLLIGLISGQ